MIFTLQKKKTPNFWVERKQKMNRQQKNCREENNALLSSPNFHSCFRVVKFCFGICLSLASSSSSSSPWWWWWWLWASSSSSPQLSCFWHSLPSLKPQKHFYTYFWQPTCCVVSNTFLAHGYSAPKSDCYFFQLLWGFFGGKNSNKNPTPLTSFPSLPSLRLHTGYTKLGVWLV